jgi:cobaltochelatase CobS
MSTQTERLEAIIADPQTRDDIKQDAQQKLNEIRRLESVGSAQVQLAAATGQGDAEVMAVLAGLQQALQMGGGKVSMTEVRKAVSEELAKRKITESDLSPDLLAMLQSTRKVTLTIGKLLGVNSTKQVSGAALNRPLTQLILSDLMARNNVYLYGGAGTGKTYLAEEIAGMLGWEPITLNCNQYTSPIDILGGQTITGYQEGKVSMAWVNKITLPDGTKKDIEGAVLILDELPKIDPNTAGILNEALAKVKDYKIDEATGNPVAPFIRNGKNEILRLGNLLVIATGNVALNTIDPDYEANFKQDLSLQDRFVGSTYKVFVDYKYEFENVMYGFAFIWLFLVKLREAIVEVKAGSQAFVSMRLMINMKATYLAYREITGSVKNVNIVDKSTGKNKEAISNPKTVIQAMETFFALFKPAQIQPLKDKCDYEGFKRIVESKNAMPYNPQAPNFDTPEELRQGAEVVREYQAKNKNI